MIDRNVARASRSFSCALKRQARRLRYVLISSFLVQYSAVRAATLVHPQRDDLAGRSFLEVGIPLETYTNGLVFYMDAAAGDYNAGETNYFIPDLSTNHSDATQTGTGYQPTRVFTNGAWAYDFDGVDDYVRLGSTITDTSYDKGFAIEMVVALAGNSTEALYASSVSAGNRTVIYYTSTSFIISHYTGSSVGHRNINDFTLNVPVKVRWEHGANGVYDRLYFDDVEVSLRSFGGTSVGSLGTTLGSLTSGAYAMNGYISSFRVESHEN